MKASLCVILPVRNAQSHLAHLAAGLLEVLPELAPRFDLLIVDNGSTDATSDIAHELESRYPQVRLLRHGMPVDMAHLVRGAHLHTTADWLLVCDEGCRLELQDLHKLWRNREDYDAILAWPPHAGATDQATFTQKMRAWRLRLARPVASEPPLPGYQLVHRRVLEKLRFASRDRHELLAELSRHALRWQVVEVRRAEPEALAALQRAGESMRLDEQNTVLSGPITPRRSRQLDAIKDFARGE